jgi:hypothetical protein
MTQRNARVPRGSTCKSPSNDKNTSPSKSPRLLLTDKSQLQYGGYFTAAVARNATHQAEQLVTAMQRFDIRTWRRREMPLIFSGTNTLPMSADIRNAVIRAV